VEVLVVEKKKVRLERDLAGLDGMGL